MTLQISVPSKTFLVGEYAVLHEGPAVLLNSKPRFRLRITKKLSSKIEVVGIHENSPAGKLIHRDVDFYKNYSITFIDSHRGLGGFGASTAQFVMIAALKHYTCGETISSNELLKNYQTLAWEGHGVPPSGVDLIAQLDGGLCFFHKAKNRIKRFSWPFSDLYYGLIHTGNKLATHLHLRQLVPIVTTEFENVVYACLDSMEQKNSENFIAAIRSYVDLLAEKNLVAEHTQKILQQLASCSYVLAAKGCGALGADVILIIFNKAMQANMISWLNEKNLHLINWGYEVEKGLQIIERNVGQEEM